MSTTIESIHGQTITLIQSGSAVVIRMNGLVGRVVRRTNLIAALRTEGIIPAEPEPLAEWEMELLTGKRLVPADALVIQRQDLTDVDDGVTTSPDGCPFTATDDDTPESLRAWGLAYLALAEWRAANPPTPPMNEAEVDRIASSLPSIGIVLDSKGCAKSLYAAGVRFPEQVQS